MSESEQLSLEIPMSKIVAEIQAELGDKFMGTVIRWADANYNGAWSRTLDLFDWALGTRDPEKIRTVQTLYRATALSFVRAYKREKEADETASFLNSLGEKNSLTAQTGGSSVPV